MLNLFGFDSMGRTCFVETETWKLWNEIKLYPELQPYSCNSNKSDEFEKNPILKISEIFCLYKSRHYRKDWVRYFNKIFWYFLAIFLPPLNTDPPHAEVVACKLINESIFLKKRINMASKPFASHSWDKM